MTQTLPRQLCAKENEIYNTYTIKVLSPNIRATIKKIEGVVWYILSTLN